MASRDPRTSPAVGDVVTYPPWRAVFVVTRVTASHVSFRPTRLERVDAPGWVVRNVIERRGRRCALSSWRRYMGEAGVEVLHACYGRVPVTSRK